MRNAFSVGVSMRLVPWAASTASESTSASKARSASRKYSASTSAFGMMALRSWLNAIGRIVTAIGRRLASDIPRVAISTVPAGTTLLEEIDAPREISSSVVSSRSTCRSLELAQGTSGCQFDGSSRGGVPPDSQRPTNPSRALRGRPADGVRERDRPLLLEAGADLLHAPGEITEFRLDVLQRAGGAGDEELARDREVVANLSVSRSLVEPGVIDERGDLLARSTRRCSIVSGTSSTSRSSGSGSGLPSRRRTIGARGVADRQARSRTPGFTGAGALIPVQSLRETAASACSRSSVSRPSMRHDRLGECILGLRVGAGKLLVSGLLAE